MLQVDRDVLEPVISSIEELRNRLVRIERIENEESNGGRILDILKGIREHEAIRPRFLVVLNQAVILLVSYFGSAVEDIFCDAVGQRFSAGTFDALMGTDIELTVADLVKITKTPESAIAKFLVNKKVLSFQDMRAIHRGFREYVGLELQQDQVTNDIFLAQACCHAIVHVGGEVTPRLIRHVSGAIPRNVKRELVPGDLIQFDEGEVAQLAASMRRYISTLVESLESERASN